MLLLSVPYALKAADAETVGGLPASAFVLAAAATDPKLAVGAALTYALAYTLQLGHSLIAYFGDAPR